jgi:Ca2+-dependent lipid-binding protein
VGLRCKHKKLGIVGAILSFLFSLGFSLLSLLFGMIVAFIFMTIIYRKFKRETAAQKASAAQNTTEPEESAQADHDPWE